MCLFTEQRRLIEEEIKKGIHASTASLMSSGVSDCKSTGSDIAMLDEMLTV